MENFIFCAVKIISLSLSASPLKNDITLKDYLIGKTLKKKETKKEIISVNF